MEGDGAKTAGSPTQKAAPESFNPVTGQSVGASPKTVGFGAFTKEMKTVNTSLLPEKRPEQPSTGFFRREAAEHGKADVMGRAKESESRPDQPSTGTFRRELVEQGNSDVMGNPKSPSPLSKSSSRGSMRKFLADNGKPKNVITGE